MTQSPRQTFASQFLNAQMWKRTGGGGTAGSSKKLDPQRLYRVIRSFNGRAAAVFFSDGSIILTQGQGRSHSVKIVTEHQLKEFLISIKHDLSVEELKSRHGLRKPYAPAASAKPKPQADFPYSVQLFPLSPNGSWKCEFTAPDDAAALSRANQAIQSLFSCLAPTRGTFWLYRGTTMIARLQVNHATTIEGVLL